MQSDFFLVTCYSSSIFISTELGNLWKIMEIRLDGTDQNQSDNGHGLTFAVLRYFRMPAEPPIYQNIEETDPAAGLCHPRHPCKARAGSSNRHLARTTELEPRTCQRRSWRTECRTTGRPVFSEGTRPSVSWKVCLPSHFAREHWHKTWTLWQTWIKQQRCISGKCFRFAIAQWSIVFSWLAAPFLRCIVGFFSGRSASNMLLVFVDIWSNFS